MTRIVRRRGGRRRVWLLLTVVAVGLAGMAAASVSNPGTQGATPVMDRNMDNYLFFAYDSFQMKGGDEVTALGGHIGVNSPDSSFNNRDAVLDLCQSDKKTSFGTNAQVVADTVKLSDKCNPSYVFTNRDLGSKPADSEYVPGPHSFPIVADPLATFPNFGVLTPADSTDNCNGARDLNLTGSNLTAALPVTAAERAAGRASFGNVLIKGGELNIPRGMNLYFCNLTFEQSSVVSLTGNPNLPAPKLFVHRKFSVQGGHAFEGAGPVDIYVLGCEQIPTSIEPCPKPGNDTTDIHLGRSSEIEARIWGYAGTTVALGNGTKIKGWVRGGRMFSDFGIMAELPTTTTTTTTSTTTTTTTVPPTTTSTTTTTEPTTTTTEPETTTSTIPETTTSTTRRPGGET